MVAETDRACPFRPACHIISVAGAGMENQAEMAGAVFGRGMAAMIMSIFGFFWLAWSFATISAHVNYR